MWESIESVDEYLEVWGEGGKRIYRADLPDDVALELIENYPECRKDVATNKTISAKVIRRLATDDDEMVRTVIAEKRKTPDDIKVELASDSSEMVRAEVAYNAKSPLEALQILAKDDVDRVRRTARERLDKMTIDD